MGWWNTTIFTIFLELFSQVIVIYLGGREDQIELLSLQGVVARREFLLKVDAS